MCLEKNRWTDFYADEDALVAAMLRIDASENQLPYKRPNGYLYLQSFQRQVRQGKTLSPKQMMQLKRLAKEVDKAERAQKLK